MTKRLRPLRAAALVLFTALGVGLDPAGTWAEPTPAMHARSLDRAMTLERELVGALRGVEAASVTIVAERALAAARRPGKPAPYVVQGAGSGVLVRWNGTWVLTNAHVVAGSPRLRAISFDGRAHELRVHSSDRRRDLAIARLVDAPQHVRPVRIPGPRSGRLAEGTWVTAAGNPFMLALDGRSAATVGVISAMRPAHLGGYVRVPTVQHDAEVNPGNSGGALWNLRGELLGINGSIATRSQTANSGPSYTGASFAVPLDAIRTFLTNSLGPDRSPKGRDAPITAELRDVESEYRRVIERVMPSAAVCVPHGVYGRAAGYSSGVAVHPSGLILSDGDAGLVWRSEWADGRRRTVRTWQNDVDVKMWDPPSRAWRTWRGRVVHRDRDVDSSLIQLVERPSGGLRHFVPPGHSGSLRVGDLTLAVGTADDDPFGGPPSLTAGVVSRIEEGASGYLYTSAGVSRGANGGALVDVRGRLVGTISTYIDSEPDIPYGFLGKAVPIDRIMAQLRHVPEARPLLQVPPPQRAGATGGAALENAVHRAGRIVRPSVVSIEIDRARPISTRVPLDDRDVDLIRYRGAVSGVVARSDGLIVTSLYNLTNVSERVDPLWETPAGARLTDGLRDIRAIRVRAADGSYADAELIGYDLRWGFALLRTKTLLSNASSPTMAPATALERGRFVITAGDPYGATRPADPLLTLGVLSKYHDVSASAPWRGTWQTDAGALDGNVGGAAVDLQGRILGMLTMWDPAKHGRNSGIGFVVPWHAIQAAIPPLLRGEQPERGLIGIFFRRGPAPVIDSVVKDSGGERAGLRAGDVIHKLDDQPTPTTIEVRLGIGQRMKNERTRLTIERDGRMRDVTVILGGRERTSEPPP